MMDASIAEMIAINGLSFLARDPEVLQRFIALTGADLTTLHRSEIDRGFLAGVLDYYLSDERLLLAYVAEADINPAEIGLARSALEGEQSGG